MICATVMTVLSVPISAKSVTYKNPSSVYKGSIYYRSLTSVSLTGDERRDVIAVAISQLYYNEGNSTADFGGFNTSGDQNFTEYNYNYGKLDQNGDGKLTHGYPWCAAFVSFCLRRANISTAVAPSHVNCTTWLNIFKKGSSNYSYYARGSYKPLMGDIIFYRSAGISRASDHVGLVIGTSKDRVFAIEGNTSNGVYIKSYKLNDTYIVGYAVPKYKSSVKSSALSGKYVVNAETSLNVRSGPSKEQKILGTLKHGVELRLHRIEGDWAYVSANGITGWISTKYLAPIEAHRVKVSVKYGKSTFDFFAGAGYAISIEPADKKSGYTFEGFADQSGKRYSAGKAISFKSNAVLTPIYTAVTSKPQTTPPPSPPAAPETPAPPPPAEKPGSDIPPSTDAPILTDPPVSDEATSPSDAMTGTENDGITSDVLSDGTSAPMPEDSTTKSGAVEGGGCASSVSLSVSFILILGASVIFASKRVK